MKVTKKPKIAILTIRNSYNYGGVLSSLKVVYEFCEQYFQPTVFFLGFDKEVATSLRSGKFTSSIKPLTYFGMNCIEIGARWAFWEPGHYAFTLSYWKKALEGYDYFFVVSGTCIAAHPLVQLNKRFTMWIGTPYDEDRSERVKQLKGIRALINKVAHRSMNSIEREILQKADFIWAISSYAKTHFERIGGIKRNTLITSGYPIGSVPHVALTKSKDKIIVAVGRFSDPRKNIHMLLRVFDGIYQNMPDIKLYIIGMPPSNDLLTTYSQKKSFSHVIFTGQTTSDDLKILLGKASLMLITSYQEGLGIVGLEALLHGTPVIATDCGGTKDYVIDSKTGYLVSINDDTDMIEKALLILSNDQHRHELSCNGRTLIEEHFSIQKIYAAFKHGLTIAYPELTEWLKACDVRKAEKSLYAHNPASHKPLLQERS